MAPACQVAALWGEDSETYNGLCPSFCLVESCPPALALMPDTSVSPSMPLVPQCWSSEGVSLSKSVCEFFKWNSLGI